MRRLFAGAFLCVLTMQAMADHDPSKPRFEVGTSLVWGTATELVLRNGTYANPLSRLVWDVPPSLALDVSVEWPWLSWTSTTVALRGTFPLMLGTMVDEDWNTGTSALDYTYGRSFQQAPMTANWSARIQQDFLATPQARSGFGLLYRWVSWEGWNGTGHYQYVDGSTANYTFSGMIIAYRQQWFIPYVSVSWSQKISGWTVTPSFRFSPRTFCYDIDNHNYSGAATKTFLDSTEYGVYGQAGLEAEFAGGPGWTWGIRGSWEMTWGSIGSTTTTSTYASSVGVTQTYGSTPNTAGAWFQETSLTYFVRN